MVVTPVFGVPHVYDFTPNLFSTSHRSVLVCVHGWLLSRTYWQPLMQQLAPDIACLAYDLRGFGDSTQQLSKRCSALETSTYGLTAYAHDLNTLLDALDLNDVWLMGHSLGGSIALWAATCFQSGSGV